MPQMTQLSVWGGQDIQSLAETHPNVSKPPQQQLQEIHATPYALADTHALCALSRFGLAKQQ